MAQKAAEEAAAKLANKGLTDDEDTHEEDSEDDSADDIAVGQKSGKREKISDDSLHASKALTGTIGSTDGSSSIW